MKYAYRSIAEFIKHVTDEHDVEEGVPAFPELREGGQLDGASGHASHNPDSNSPREGSTDALSNGLKSISAPVSDVISSLSGKSATNLYEENRWWLGEV